MGQDIKQYFYLESPTRGYVGITNLFKLNMQIIFNATDPTFFKSKQKCEDFAKMLCYQVADIEVRSTDGLENWYVKLLELYAI